MAKIALSLAIGIGGALLSAALAPKPKDQFGPRLSDINVAQVSPGQPVIRHWGTMKLPGTIIWTSELIETEHVEEMDSGKKGGKGDSPTMTTYTYSVDCAIGVCRGPVRRVNRVWANQKLLWIHPELMADNAQRFEDAYYAELDRLVNQAGVWRTDEAYCGAFFFAFNNYRPDEYTYKTKDEALDFIMSHPGVAPHVVPAIAPPNRDNVSRLLDQMLDVLGHDMEYATYKIRFDYMNIYLGSEQQLPNAKMEEYMGIGNVPAYRGLCYLVIHNLQLEDFGNGIPQFNVEVERDAGDVQLYRIIEDICLEAGLQPGEFDGLGHMKSTASLTGYAITQSASARQILNSLQQVFPFDASESGYKLIFSWINQRPKAIIRREDFGTHTEGGERPPSVETTRVHDFDLPRRLQIKFQEPARNYSPNTVYATRQATEGNTVDEIDVTMAMTRAVAKTCAEEMLALKFTARKSHKVFLPRKYAILEPGDPVLVRDPSDPTGNTFLSWRCVSVDIGMNGVCEFLFVDHNQFIETLAITEEDLDVEDNETPEMPVNSLTYAYMLDLPLLTDTEEDNIGYYAVLTGSRQGWAGGVLLLDISSGGIVEAFGNAVPYEATGSRWYVAARNQFETAHGMCMNALAPALPDLWDNENTLLVYLLGRHIDLAPVNRDDMLGQPLNIAVIGDEIVQYSEARDLGNGMWELSGFLRGLRGTDWAINKHVEGERFVRLRAASIQRVTHDASTLNRPASYRAISFGTTPDQSESFEFSNTGNSLRPFAPAIHEVRKAANGDRYIRWSPRARQNGGLFNGRATPLDQPFERYEIDVLNGDTVVRTTTFDNVREWTYTAAMQASDFGGVQDKVSVRLYQMGQIIGRGFARELEV